MANSDGPSTGRRLARAAQVIVVSSVMFTFISYWRTAAVVLCDLASTVYYIGGIVENAIGPAAPWFILAVMVFSYAVRSVYIESCSLFVRGGVYRVVKQAMGGALAKLSVSALLFDYVLTGPTSGVSAGQYIMGLILQFINFISPEASKAFGLDQRDSGEFGEAVIRWGSVALAAVVTLYFLRQNLLGLHESSDKSLKIMKATTVMAVVVIVWCAVTLIVRGPSQSVALAPDLNVKVEHAEIPRDQAANPERFTPEEDTVWIRDPSRADRLRPKIGDDGQPIVKENEAVKEIAQVTGLDVHMKEDPLGFLGQFQAFGFLRAVGLLGLFLAFGHSILAMSGEETLAQVYREVEAPKLKNFKRAAFIVFVYSLVLTAGVSFLAVMIIPDEVRMKFYSGNLISGLARHVIGPPMVKLALETFVVVVGFLILAGAVNTAIIGSNGVLNRIAEDGVLPDWFLKPHPRYGTTYRLLYLIAGMQLAVILLSMGHIIVLGEAYAFGVVWSFVFKAFAMIVLRFTNKTPREYKVPFNLRVGRHEIPLGLIAIFLVLLIAAILNFFTKEVATISGLIFTLTFLTVFVVSERTHERRRGHAAHEHLDQFNRDLVSEASVENLGITHRYRKLVAIRSPQNLFMLEKALNETDPRTTDLIVMTAKLEAPSGMGDAPTSDVELHGYDQQLMTAVVQRAESSGKVVRPLIVPTNNPLHAVLATAQKLDVQEIILGASNKFSAEDQLDQISLYWLELHGGEPAPLSVRILSRGRDVRLDLGGGSPIPVAETGPARSTAELRTAGIGVRRVLLVHDGGNAAHTAFESVMTMLDAEVDLDVVAVGPPDRAEAVEADRQSAARLGRSTQVYPSTGDVATAVVERAEQGQYDLIIVAPGSTDGERSWVAELTQRAPCALALFAAPVSMTQQV